MNCTLFTNYNKCLQNLLYLLPKIDVLVWKDKKCYLLLFWSELEKIGRGEEEEEEEVFEEDQIYLNKKTIK